MSLLKHRDTSFNLICTIVNGIQTKTDMLYETKKEIFKFQNEKNQFEKLLLEMLVKVEKKMLGKICLELEFLNMHCNEELEDLEDKYEHANLNKHSLPFSFVDFSRHWKSITNNYHIINFFISMKIRELRTFKAFDESFILNIDLYQSSDFILEKELELDQSLKHSTQKKRKRKTVDEEAYKEALIDSSIASMVLYSNECISLRNRNIKKKPKC